MQTILFQLTSSSSHFVFINQHDELIQLFIGCFSSWTKDGSVLDLNMEAIAARFALLPSGALEIRNIRNVDGGLYRCQATNDVTGQTVQSRQATLTVIPGEFSLCINLVQTVVVNSTNCLQQTAQNYLQQIVQESEIDQRTDIYLVHKAKI